MTHYVLRFMLAPPGLDQDLRVVLGRAEVLERLRHSLDAHLAGDQRLGRDRAFGDVTQHRAELLAAIAKDKLDVQLLVDPEQRLNGVSLHTDTDNNKACSLWRCHHDLVDHAGDTDALEDHGGAERWTRGPRRELRRAARVAPDSDLAPALVRRLLRGIDDHVGADCRTELASPGRRVGGDG